MNHSANPADGGVRAAVPDDRVLIRELRADTLIGVHDWERQVRQTVVLDLDLAWDNRQAAQTDDLSLALDYQAVAERLREYIATCQFQLIEALAESCARLVLQEFAVPWVRLTLSKPGALPCARAVGVTIERFQS